MPSTDTYLARLVVPLAVTVAVAVLVRLIGGRNEAARIASVAVPAGMIAGYAVQPGWPWTPPTEAIDKLAWLALGGGLLGLAIDLGTRGRILTIMAALAWPAVGIAWLGGPELLNGQDSSLYRFGEVSLVLGLLLARLGQLSGDGLQGPVTAAVVAGGVACLGLVSGAPELAAIGLPLAACGLGWLASNWPRRRFGFGAAGLLGGSGVALVLAGNAALLTPANGTLVLLALSALLFQPVVPALARRVPALASPALRPLATAVVVAVPSAVAILIAWLVPGLVPALYG
ncbi:hypothetical protein GCM10017083_22610 [Thalassobaculum fulvum]|uniref:Uncharacterized protein n=1 Tax=Thalassobaculum fulvum TaxID=1633335 RepID=A0A918XRG3_9PROT|nr:hypothetical protein [Thalassobaculum fulvum]GHD49818.1 hypothetical protein GCM10017083_22610 [Thalassobaculum fulvum]